MKRKNEKKKNNGDVMEIEHDIGSFYFNCL